MQDHDLNHPGTPNIKNSLPRELVPGLFWLGDCLEQKTAGKIYHTYNAAYLLVGDDACAVVETGHPKDFPLISKQLDGLLPGRPHSSICSSRTRKHRIRVASAASCTSTPSFCCAATCAITRWHFRSSPIAWCR